VTLTKASLQKSPVHRHARPVVRASPGEVPEDEMARGRREDEDLQGLVMLERVSSLCDLQERRVCSMPKRI
jgi:hypothetical protein